MQQSLDPTVRSSKRKGFIISNYLYFLVTVITVAAEIDLEMESLVAMFECVLGNIDLPGAPAVVYH